ncbi:hypoxia-inducible factor 1-alpha isoform X2 [Microplitis mediator]|uniref:hypoxia-inducible factor 1-alpha isoform X2 n=1 Tax=Microplitis mediator TaxID=375433 RepID=UPI002552B578|nr:hypoxia-inducible factor 1-alpha isoform X2 [Microplitis mediator]
MMESKKKLKEKRRSNDKRKEKSRDAARCRRSRETDIFVNMAAALPISPDETAHLDKSSVMRLAIAYLKIRSVATALEKPLAKIESTIEGDEFFPQALDGFMLVLASNGDMVYLSENVSEYLGISQLDMMGQSVYDYSHPCDHDEIREFLLMKPKDIDEKCSCNFFIRLKCTLTNKGKKVNLKSASYKVIHCTGRPMVTSGIAMNDGKMNGESWETSSLGSEDQNECETETSQLSSGVALVMVGCPIPHPSNIEIPLGRQTFLSKHNLNMKFTYADERLAEHFGWSNNELIGKSIFELHHALDNHALDKSFKCLFSKGQCETVAYRFLGRTGGYAWVVTQATLIHCTKKRKPLSIVCVNYILSDIEYGDEVYSICQLEARNSLNNLKKAKTVDEEIIRSSEIQNNYDSIKSIEKVSSPSIPYQLTEDGDLIVSEEHARPLVPVSSEIENKLTDSKKWLFQNKPVIDYNLNQTRRSKLDNSSIESVFDQDTPLSIANRSSPHTATASIFAPRTEDMNKGFLTFSDDQPGLTMLKDEPEDLTHLAPTPGDVCVPLEDTPFLSDMLDEFMFGSENYCTLLSPIIPTELPDSHTELIEDTIKKHDNFGDTLENDPFFCRNSSPVLDSSQSSTNFYSHSPSKSPELFSTNSLHSSDIDNVAVGSGISEDELLMLNIDEVIADDELVSRAPYIPMSDQDEALQLLISDNMVMWGPTQPPDKSNWNIKRDRSDYYKESSLAKLLKNDNDQDKHEYVIAMDPDQMLDQTSKIGHKRSNKRLHETSSLNTEDTNKRMKYQNMMRDTSPTSITVTKPSETNLSHVVESTAGVNGVKRKSPRIDDIKNSNNKRSKMRLLQQLIEEHELSTTMKSGKLNHLVDGMEHFQRNDIAGDIDGDSENLQERQSNSVLMNLLISGCDKIYVELPTLLEDISINGDH